MIEKATKHAAHDGAKMAQDGAKMAQDGVNMIQDGATMAQDGAKMAVTAESQAIVFFFRKIHLCSRGTLCIFFHEVLASNCDCQNFMRKLLALAVETLIS